MRPEKQPTQKLCARFVEKGAKREQNESTAQHSRAERWRKKSTHTQTHTQHTRRDDDDSDVFGLMRYRR